MERLMNALANNGWAKDHVKLVHVTAMTWQDAQYSSAASETAKILADYSEYANYTIGELKERYLLHK
jgi:hypothetical protein